MKGLTKALIFTFLLISCQNSNTRGKNELLTFDSITPDSQIPVIIDIEQDFNNEKKFTLSEIAYDIEYVKLEKTQESLVGGGNPSWYITKEYIFVKSMGQLLQFNRNGKFIQEISKEGRGPGEIPPGLNGIEFDETNNTIYIMGNYISKVLKFNAVTGAFLGDFPISNYLGAAGMGTKGFQMINKDTFIALSNFSLQFTSDYILYEIFNDQGKILTNKKSPIHSMQKNIEDVKGGRSGFTQIWSFGGELKLFEDLNDTIYNIKDNQLAPAYIINLGKYKGPLDLMITTYIQDQSNNFVRLFGFWETQKYLLFNFYYKGVVYRGLYDKKDIAFFKIIPSNNNAYIYNDIDGGLAFWPWYPVNNVDNEWVYCIDAIDLKHQLSLELLEYSKALYPEKKEQLQKFIEELSVDDNPVVMIVKLNE